MKKLVYVIVIVIFFLLTLSFYLKNPHPVTLSYYMGIEYEISLSLLLWTVLLIGVVIGWLVGLVQSLKLRRRLAKVSRKLRDAETCSTGEELTGGNLLISSELSSRNQS